MPKFLMALSLLFLTATSATVAAQGPCTDQAQNACVHDVEKFCRPLMDQDELIIVGCLKGNRQKLSPKIATKC